jgi:hypothetical protein
MMREVKHSNILEILELFEGDNNIYCLGYLYKGDTLASVIHDKTKKFDERHIIRFAGKMLNVGIRFI